MAIDNVDDARELADMLRSGELTGDAAERAWADLEAFDATAAEEAPAQPRATASFAPVVTSAEQAQEAQAGRARGARLALGSVAAGAAAIPIGIGQAAAGLQDLFGGDRSLARYTLAADELLSDIRGSDERNPVEFGVEMLAGSRFGPGPAKTHGFARVVGKGAVNAAFASAIGFDSEAFEVAEKGRSIALGTGLGLLTAGVLAGVHNKGELGRDKLAQMYTRYLLQDADPKQVEMADELVTRYPELADYMTFGQLSGSQSMQRAEAQVAGKYAINAFRKQTEIMRNAMDDVRRRYVGTISEEDIARIPPKELTQAAVRRLSAMRADRKVNWKGGIENAKIALNATQLGRMQNAVGAGYAPLEVPALNEKLGELLKKWPTLRAQDLSQPLQRVLAEGSRRGVMRVDDFVAALSESNPLAGARVARNLNPEQRRAFGRQVQKLLMEHVQEFDPEVSDGVKILQDTVAKYADQSAEIDRFRNSGVAKALGITQFGAKRPVSVRDALASISRLPEGEQAYARLFLKQNAPQLLNATRVAAWNDLVAKHERYLDSGAQGTFDPVKFADEAMRELGDPRNPMGSLYTKTELVGVRAAMRNIRQISAKLDPSLNTATPEMVTQTVPVKPTAANLPFRWRLWYRLAGRRGLEYMLHTPEGRASLGILTKEGGFNAATLTAEDYPKIERLMGRLATEIDIYDKTRPTLEELDTPVEEDEE